MSSQKDNIKETTNKIKESSDKYIEQQNQQIKDTNSIFFAYDIIIPVNLVFPDLLINNSKTIRKSMLGQKVESQKLDLSTSTGSMYYKIKWIHITSVLWKFT